MNAESPTLLQRFLRIGTTYRVPSLIFLLVVSLLAALGLPRVTIDAGFERLGPATDPAREAYLHVAREFGSDNRTFIYLRDEQLWSPAKLQALEQLHRELQQLPFVERIDDLFTAHGVRSIDGQLQAQVLLAGAPEDAEGAERARRTALDTPTALRNIVSADGKAIAIGVAVRERHEGAAGSEINDALERLLVPARKHFATAIQVGPPRVEAEIRQGIVRDLSLLVPAAILLLVLGVFAFCRSVFAALASLLVGSLSLLWTFGLMGHAGIPLSILSAMLPALVVAIAAAEIVRMASVGDHAPPAAATADEAASMAGAAGSMARSLGRPAVLTLLTTALGFASNAFSGIEIIRDFALAATFAVLANGLITVLLVPMLHAALGLRLAPRRHLATGRAATVALGVLAWLRRRSAMWGLAIAAALCTAAVQLAPSLQVSNEPLSFFSTDRPLVQAAAVMHDDLAGVGIFYITLDGNAEGAFRDPANLQRLADIQAFISKQQIFDRSLSLADMVAQANQASANGRPDAYRVPPSRKLAAQYLLLYPPQALAPYVSHDFRRANIVVRHSMRDSSTLNRHVRELQQAVTSYAGPGMATALVGENLLINGAADRLLKGQALALAALLVVVFIVTSLMFTSAKGGIVALVPSMLPILMILGIMRVLAIPLNAGTALVAIVAIVIALEGTVRLFSRYSELCRGATTYDEAVVATVKTETAPMVAVSLAVAAGFGVLALSEFALIAQFGVLAAVAMLASIVVNLLITPLVMSHVRPVGLYEILAVSMQREALEHSPLFHDMTPYQIRKTILLSELREYRDGDRLIEQGTMGRSMYIVVGGQLEVVRRDGARETRLARLGPGDVFGEIGFVHETYRTADVRALGAVSVLCIDHERLKKDLALFPHIMSKLNFNISGILGKRLAEVVDANHAPAAKTADDR